MSDESGTPQLHTNDDTNVAGDSNSSQVINVEGGSTVSGTTQIDGDVTESVIITAGRDVNIHLASQVTQQVLSDLLEPLQHLAISTLAETPPEHRLPILLSLLPKEEIARLAKEIMEQSGVNHHILFRDIVLDDDAAATEHARKGFVALATGQPKLAMHHFECAIEVEDGCADAWLGLSWAQYESNQLEEALTSIVEAEKRSPALLEKNRSARASILVEYGRAYGVEHFIQEGIQIFEEILAEDSAQAMIWYNLGNSYSALADYDQAMTCFKHAIDLQPDFPDIHVNLGIVFYHLGQHEAELDCYNRALEIEPDHPQALVSKGATLSIVYNKQIEAVDLFEQVLDKAPGFCHKWPKIWYNLGYTRALAGRYEQAYDALIHFRKIAPTVQVDDLLAHVLSALWREEPDTYAAEAAEFFTGYAAIKPDDRRARLELGEIFYWLRKYDQALEAYPAFDLSSEPNATLLDHYGHCLANSGREEESLSYFARASELSSQYRHCYARQLLLLERYAEALSNLLQVTDDHRDEPTYLCDLGICYANLGDDPAALIAFNRAIDQDEEYANAWYYLGSICAYRHGYRFALAALAYAGQLDDELAPRATRVAEEARERQQGFAQSFLRGLRSHLVDIDQDVDSSQRTALRLLYYGDGYREQKKFEQAQALYQRVLSYCRGGTYPWLAAAVTHQLAQVARDTGNLDQACALYDDAFDMAITVQDDLLIAETGSEGGNVLSAIGQYRRAIHLLETALERERYAGRDILIAATQHDLAATYYQSGDLIRARDMYRQALASSEQYDYDLTRVISWEGLGHTYRDMGLCLLSIEFYRKALTFRQDHDDLVGIGRVLNGMGVAYHWLGDYGRAVNTLSESAEIKRESDTKVGLPDAYVNLGNLFTDLKAYDQARFYYGLAQSQFVEAQNAQGFVDATINVGVSLEEEGSFEQATELYRNTLAIFAETSEVLAAKLRFYLGQALWRNGKWEEARQILHAAHGSATGLGLAGLAESCQEVIALLESDRKRIEPESESFGSSAEDELVATASQPGALNIQKTLWALEEGICPLDDFCSEINLRFAYPDTIVRVQGITLLSQALPLLEEYRELWQRFKELREDPDALVRAVFCVTYTACYKMFDEVDEAADTLLSLTYDEDSTVRATSLSGLAELHCSLPTVQRQRIEERVSQMVDNEQELVQIAAQRFHDQNCSEKGQSDDESSVDGNH